VISGGFRLAAVVPITFPLALPSPSYRTFTSLIFDSFETGTEKEADFEISSVTPRFGPKDTSSTVTPCSSIAWSV
jgi:hypothetical protein